MIYVVLLLSSFLLTWYIKNYFIKHSLVVEVSKRSLHTTPTPQGGGIAIAITWFLGLIYLYFTSFIDDTLFYLLMLGLPIAILGFCDDMYDVGVGIRFMIQSIVAICALYLLGGLNSIECDLFSITNPYITNLFAFLVIVWFINLYNFLDGINGYAGSEAVFLAICAFIIFGGEHFLVFLVCVLGFLYWNFNNAKIFMGDVGSTLLGYTIGVFTLYYANIEPLNLWIWAMLSSLFWFDATITLIKRAINGDDLTKPHNDFLFHKLIRSGWSHFKVTNYAICINIVLFILVLLVLEFSNLFVPAITTLIILFFLMFLIYKYEKRVKEKSNNNL